MKKLLAAVLLLATCAASAYDHVRWTFADYTDSPLTIRRVNIQPLYTYTITGTNFNTGDRRTYTNTATGTLVVSNIVAGSYAVEFVGPWRSTWVTNTFWGTNGLIDAKDYTSVTTLSGFTAAYSQAVADLRFIRSTNGNGTNLTVRGLTMPVGAVSNYVWTATNTSGAGTWAAQVAGGSGSGTFNFLALTNWHPTVSNLAGLSSNNYVGTFTGNGAGITNLTAGNIALNPQLLLNPPHIGGSSNLGSYFTTENNSQGVMISGAGMVRDLWIQCELGVAGGLNTNLQNLRLEVFADGGNTTNLSFRTIDVSLADVFGNRFRFLTNGPWAIDRDSFGVNTMDRSTNRVYGGYIKTLKLCLPMFFTNNCLIRLTNSATGAIYSGGYMSVTVQRASNLDALGDYKTWRLRTKTTFGAVSGSASNFLFSATGPGICVGWLQSLHDPSGVNLGNFLDSIAPAWLTAPGTVWEVAGGDDLFLSTYYMRGGISLGYRAGVINRWFGSNDADNGMTVEAYRWYDDDPIYWANGVTVYIPDCQPLAAMSATMFYYAP